MEFEKDILISYAHLDNKIVDEKLQSWVNDFHQTLLDYVAEKWGETPVIWRDNQLRGNDNFDREIKDKFPKLKILVSVITPRYVKSDWCKTEVEEFLRAAKNNGGIEIENKSRVFKILKTPVKLEEQPESIRQYTGYEFYRIDPTSNEEEEFKKEFGEEFKNLYYRAVNRVAQDIAKLLKHLGNKSTPATIPKGTVYLADTSDDLLEDRQKIQDELEDRGYTVSPNKNLPRVADKFIADVEKYMNDCMLSIHLVSYDDYGPIPSKTNKSNVELQIEISGKQSATGKLDRLIWLVPKTKMVSPTNNKTEDPSLTELIKHLREKEDLQGNSDMLEVDELQVFEKAIFDTIDKRKAREAKEEERMKRSAIDVNTATANNEVEPKMIYFICDQRDVEGSKSLRDFLDNAGHQVNIPSFEGDAMTEEIENLESCDAVIIYYGYGDKNWVNSKINALNKIKNKRIDFPFLDKLVYISNSTENEKSNFTTKLARVKTAQESFNPDLLDEFIQKLK